MTDRRKIGGSSFLSGPLEKSLLALEGAITGNTLIKTAFKLFRRAVPCEFIGALFRIEMHEHGAIGYRLIDSRGRDFSAELVDGRLFANHPAMPIVMANPGIRFVNTRETLPPDEILHASPFYREVMKPMGFRHAIGMFFWSDPPRIPHEAVFSLCRVEGRPDFNDEEVAILDSLYPHIDVALRRVRALDRERAARGEMRRLINRPGPACVLHWDLAVAEVNRAAREICARWHLGDASARVKVPPFRLPAPLADACAELKQRWSASHQHHPETGTPARISIRHPEWPSLGATVTLHTQHTDPLGKPALLIEFAPPSIAVRRARGKIHAARLGDFTLAERELIRLVCAGRSNQEIATETGKALGTVKNALHAIFGKAGVRSRSALIARLRD